MALVKTKSLLNSEKFLHINSNSKFTKSAALFLILAAGKCLKHTLASVQTKPASRFHSAVLSFSSSTNTPPNLGLGLVAQSRSLKTFLYFNSLSPEGMVGNWIKLVPVGSKRDYKLIACTKY